MYVKYMYKNIFNKLQLINVFQLYPKYTVWFQCVSIYKCMSYFDIIQVRNNYMFMSWYIGPECMYNLCADAFWVGLFGYYYSWRHCRKIPIDMIGTYSLTYF